MYFDFPEGRGLNENTIQTITFTNGQNVDLRHDLKARCAPNFSYVGISSTESKFVTAYSKALTLVQDFLNAAAVLTACPSVVARHKMSFFAFKQDPLRGSVIFVDYANPSFVPQGIWSEMRSELELLVFSRRISRSVKMALSWLRTAHLQEVRETRFAMLLMALECLAGATKSGKRFTTRWDNLRNPATRSGTLTSSQVDRLINLRNSLMHGRPSKKDYQAMDELEPNLPQVFVQMLRRNKKVAVSQHVEGVGRGRPVQGSKQIFIAKDRPLDPRNDDLNPALKDILEFLSRQGNFTSGVVDWAVGPIAYDPRSFRERIPNVRDRTLLQT